MFSTFSGILGGSESSEREWNDLPALHVHDTDRTDETNPGGLSNLSVFHLPAPVQPTHGHEEVMHRCNPYLTNRSEQDHRGVKQRDYPMRGFGTVNAAARFCRAFDHIVIDVDRVRQGKILRSSYLEW